jgi:hypothetical protein
VTTDCFPRLFLDETTPETEAFPAAPAGPPPSNWPNYGVINIHYAGTLGSGAHTFTIRVACVVDTGIQMRGTLTTLVWPG